MISCFKAKIGQNQSKKNFIANGGILLEEIIAFTNGRSNPIRHFSEEELLKATNNYYKGQLSMLSDSNYKMFKGSLKDRPIIVKKYVISHGDDEDRFAYKDIAIGSKMSAHKNVLKVLGCCLETKEPIIVYEFGGTKLLKECIFAITNNVEPLQWKSRLKIARDLASAIAYLHTAFPRPIIHRDITPYNVILDDNNVPRLADFGLCISIPQGESHVKDRICGTYGYLAPELVSGDGRISEKADVYSFGILLLELLIGERIIDFFKERDLEWKDLSSEIVDNIILTNNKEIEQEQEQEQLLDFKTLAIRCIFNYEEQRPTMIEVAIQLNFMYHL